MSRICEALDCNVGDMMDIVRESPESVSMTKHTDRKLNEKA
mgnify:FL=1